jgi:hypothetical protein
VKLQADRQPLGSISPSTAYPLSPRVLKSMCHAYNPKT